MPPRYHESNASAVELVASPRVQDDDEPSSPKPVDDAVNAHKLRVNLRLRVKDIHPPLGGWLDRQLATVAAKATVTGGCLTLLVVGDTEMADLHMRYTGVSGTTDVLTFDLRDDPRGPVEGDIVLCIDQAARQARRRGHDARLELLLYAVHGLLHLLGYDDHDPDRAAQMHRREDQLLRAVGFVDVYHRPVKSSDCRRWASRNRT